MKAVLYFVAGAVVGVAATQRTRRAKQAIKASLTPSAIAADLAEAVGEIGHAIGSFAADVRAGMEERQAELSAVVDEDVRSAGGLPVLPRTTARATGAPVDDRVGTRRPA